MSDTLTKNILIVEDDTFLQSLTTKKLTGEGFTVANATTKEQVEQQTTENQFDFILLDLILPGTSGFELLEYIRAQDKHKNIPIVIFSNLSSDDDFKKADELGATDFMVKSNFTLDDLVEKIKTS
ncbi:MAG: two-component system OmpR family response regulator [Flavobacteriaceae bacterium]|jgi:two-component system OmpR family response regulator